MNLVSRGLHQHRFRREPGPQQGLGL